MNLIPVTHFGRTRITGNYVYKGKIIGCLDCWPDDYHVSTMVRKILEEKDITGAYGKIPGTVFYLYMNKVNFKRGNIDHEFGYAFETDCPLICRRIKGYFSSTNPDSRKEVISKIIEYVLIQKKTDSNLPDEFTELIGSIIFEDHIVPPDRRFFVMSKWEKRPDIMSEIISFKGGVHGKRKSKNR